MFGNPAAERAAIEMTYEDTCTIYRMAEVTGSNKITKMERVPVAENVICSLSSMQIRPSEQTAAQNDVEYTVKLFLGPEINVLPGDQIDVKRFGRVNPASGTVLKYESTGQPMVYATHQEIMVKGRDIA
ncbi:hypothetical protein [Acetivibrio straminisolvens]|uniref:hypothetical protein n=1 Tax=Acetivibrio straminisolvens TaxID=253314 RepID=UPI0005710989|nr:hypothetical protein [Acetivibrio straminisolvens]